MRSVAIIIPTFLEAENIVDVLGRARKAVPYAHVMVVDDSSPDGTAELAKKTNERLGQIDVLSQPDKAGLGSAYRTGFREAFDGGFDVIVQMDADLSHDPAALPALLERIEQGADVAIGSRYVKGGDIPNWPMLRRLLSRVGNLYASSVLGLGVRDATAGFRAYRAETLQGIGAIDTSATGYGFQLELSHRANMYGAKVVEVPIIFNDRVRGVSKMSWHIIGEAMSLVTWWAISDRLFRRGRPAPAADIPDDLGPKLQGVEGWFSPDQVARVVDRARELEAGSCIVEIGSFRGRSMIALASSAPADTTIYAIDPHAGNDRGPQQIDGFEEEAAEDHEVFQANLERAGVRDRVNYVRKFSQHAHDDVDGDIDLLHIDGAHRFSPARSDMLGWGGRVAPGGTMVIHDAFSSVGVTLAILATLTFSRRWRYVGRSRSLAEYRAEPVRGKDKARDAFRQLGQLPWFARNVAVKALTVAKLKPLTRLLGHDGAPWPY